MSSSPRRRMTRSPSAPASSARLNVAVVEQAQGRERLEGRLARGVRALALQATVAEVVGPVQRRLVEPAVVRHAQDAVDEDDVAVLLEVVELGLVADPLLGEGGQRLAQLGRAPEDPVAGDERLPDDIVPGRGEERIESSRSRAPAKGRVRAGPGSASATG